MFQSIRNYFSSIFSSSPFAATPAASQEAAPAAPKPRELRPTEEPTFLLPETAEEFRAEKARRVAAIEDRHTALFAQVAELKQRATALEAAGGLPAKSELNRREAERLHREAAERMTTHVPYYWDSTTNDRSHLEIRLRQKEAEKIIHEGEVLLKTVGQLSPTTSPWPRRDRLIVRYGGRTFLITMEQKVQWNDTGEKTRVRTGHETSAMAPVYAPGEDLGEPTLYFATESVAQMTETELLRVAARECYQIDGMRFWPGQKWSPDDLRPETRGGTYNT